MCCMHGGDWISDLLVCYAFLWISYAIRLLDQESWQPQPLKPLFSAASGEYNSWQGSWARMRIYPTAELSCSSCQYSQWIVGLGPNEQTGRCIGVWCGKYNHLGLFMCAAHPLICHSIFPSQVGAAICQLCCMIDRMQFLNLQPCLSVTEVSCCAMLHIGGSKGSTWATTHVFQWK